MMRNVTLMAGVLALIFPGLGWSLSDPTRPQNLVRTPAAETQPGLPVVVEPTYQLQYVLVSDDRRYAVINGLRVGEGDRLGKAQVLRIDPGVVRIRAAGKISDLKLGFQDIKRQGRNSR